MKNLAPRLRFFGFELQWEKKRIGDLYFPISSGKSKKSNDDGEFPFYGSTGIIGYSSSTDYNGDKLLIARVGANAGSLYKVSGDYSVSDNTLIINENPNQSLDYLFFALIKFNLNTLVFGSGQPLITGGQLSSTELAFPDLKEQNKIATFFLSLENRLLHLQKKKTLLENYKKGMMQKIFNREIRFKDVDGKDYGEWEETKLGDFQNLVHGDGNWILSNDLSIAGKYKLIQLGNIGFGRYVEKDLKTISAEKFKEINGTLLKKGDLLINRMVDDNLYCCILDKDGDYITSVDVCWIRENKMFNNYFLMSLILFAENQIKLLNLSSGSGRVRISKANMFNKFIFRLPTRAEQDKIANFLSAIDDKINLVAVQIEKMERWKKGLLGEMFV